MSPAPNHTAVFLFLGWAVEKQERICFASFVSKLPPTSFSSTFPPLPPPPPPAGSQAFQRPPGPPQLPGQHPLLHPACGRAHPRAEVARGHHALSADGRPKDHAHGPVLHERRSSVSASQSAAAVLAAGRPTGELGALVVPCVTHSLTPLGLFCVCILHAVGRHLRVLAVGST